jgi:hypothetical protein
MSVLGSKSSTGRVLGALLAGGLVLAFWGCGGSNSTNVNPGGGDASTGEDAGSDGSLGKDTGGGEDATSGQDATGSPDAAGGQDASGHDSGASGTEAGSDDSGAGGPDGGSGSLDSGAVKDGGGSGTDACVPRDCAQQGLDCGSALDGCGNVIQCGTCPTGQTCGSHSPNVCGGVVCMPKTCAQQNFDCGAATDGCGNVIQCGSCQGNTTCGAASPNVCGGPPCTGLCLQQTTCTGTATTSVSGTVYAPNGTDPLPDVLVYVPNAPVLPFTPGVSCGSCGSQVSGAPLVSAVTNYQGQFTLTNMPVGTNIPLVIQTGRWRRQFVIPTVTKCVNTPLPTTGAGQIRMPRTSTVHAGGEGDIPLMGFVTGSVDALECVLRKIGIADTEFSDPSGTGRVRFYQGNGGPGSVYSATTPTENSLWGTQAEINAYDMVYFACQGAEYDKATANQTTVINYANAGGRIFATHYSYVWLFNDTPFSTTATWDADQLPNFSSDPETGYIVTTFPKGLLLAQWLQYIGASTTLGQMPINTLRHDFDAVAATSQEWVYLNDPNYTTPVPMHYTFNTPVTAAPANQCGKVLYNDYHVEDAVTGGTTFPAECTVVGMTPQEKMLEFDIFDLGACVTPPVCTPKTCAQIGASCGPEGDGCGNIIQCGNCTSPQTCGGGGTPGVCGTGQTCTPKNCAELGFNCGSTSDGCSNVINCGMCTSPLTCGGGGQSNVCGGQF